MDANQFDALLRALPGTPSRRALTRALSGLTFGGLLGLLHLTEADAKRHKKQKRRRKKRRKKNQPFCAGKNICTDSADICGAGSFGPCGCLVTTSGTPFCADFSPGGDCTACGDGETCAVSCAGGTDCFTPCPQPLQ